MRNTFQTLVGDITIPEFKRSELGISEILQMFIFEISRYKVSWSRFYKLKQSKKVININIS